MQSLSRKRKPANPFKTWLIISASTAVFSIVYEHFSFGVYSANMICAFLYPLLLGALPCLIFRKNMGRLWNDGVLLMLFGSILAGVFDIYGTTSYFTKWFFIIGAVLLAAGILSNFFRHKRVGV